jgi:hypothetical protein
MPKQADWPLISGIIGGTMDDSQKPISHKSVEQAVELAKAGLA